MELTLGSVGVGSAVVLMVVVLVLGGPPVEIVRPPSPVWGLLLFCSATGVPEGGMGFGVGSFEVAGGGCDMELALCGCELVGRVEFSPGSGCWAEFELRPGMLARSAADGPSRPGRSILVTRRSSGRFSSKYSVRGQKVCKKGSEGRGGGGVHTGLVDNMQKNSK